MAHGGAAAASAMHEGAVRRAHIVERGENKLKKIAESQRVHEWNMP
jgi:hypothetical protein